MVEVIVGLSHEVMDKAKLAALYAEGGKRAMALMRKTVEGKKCDGVAPQMDGDLVKRLNAEIMFYGHPSVRGQFRDPSDYGTEVDTESAVIGREIPQRFYQYSRWLQESARTICLHKDDVQVALRIAAEAHYGLTGPQLHPFPEGNGRTARVLTNGFLMLGTKELTEYGFAIPPVPVLRNPNNEKGRVDPYVLALQQVRKTRTVNPLEKHIAERWSENIGLGLDCIKKHVRKPSGYDLELIGQFEHRRRSLEGFIQAEDQRSNKPHFIPSYA